MLYALYTAIEKFCCKLHISMTSVLNQIYKCRGNHLISVLITNQKAQIFNLPTPQTQPNLHFKSNVSRWNLGTPQIPQQAPLSPSEKKGRRDATRQLPALWGVAPHSLTLAHTHTSTRKRWRRADTARAMLQTYPNTNVGSFKGWTPTPIVRPPRVYVAREQHTPKQQKGGGEGRCPYGQRVRREFPRRLRCAFSDYYSLPLHPSPFSWNVPTDQVDDSKDGGDSATGPEVNGLTDCEGRRGWWSQVCGMFL